MASSEQTKSIRVHVLGREYALRVREEDEEHTRRVASFVNERMEQFKDAHPDQAELTTAVMTALALAEKLHLLREEQEGSTEALNHELKRLSQELDGVLDPPEDSETAD